MVAHGDRISMHVAVLLLTILLTGCQGVSWLDGWQNQDTPSVMPLWMTYQHCMTTTDVDLLLEAIGQLEEARLEGSEPPDWLKTFGGEHVGRQPVRTAVDPEELSAACTVRAARMLSMQERIPEARYLYRFVTSRYTSPAWTYYRQQANEALASLSGEDSTFLVQRTFASRSLIR